MKTFVPKRGDITADWWVVDADGLTLGRMSTEIALRLRGKHKPQFTPHLDCGDHVIVLNAGKIVLTGRKWLQKKYRKHSGYPGGLREFTAEKMHQRHPERLVESAVRGMLPKGPLGRAMYRKLKVYAGDNHPHEAQRPQPLVLDDANRAQES